MPHRIRPNSESPIHQPKKPANPSRALISISEATASVAKKPLDNTRNQIGADWEKPKARITKKHKGKTAEKTERLRSHIPNLSMGK